MIGIVNSTLCPKMFQVLGIEPSYDMLLLSWSSYSACQEIISKEESDRCDRYCKGHKTRWCGDVYDLDRRDGDERVSPKT